MAMTAEALTGGFDDPVFQSQNTFRIVMDALARPGITQEVTSPAAPPAGLSAAQGGILLTLADHDTPVWLSPSLSTPTLKDWVAFQTGAPLTRSMNEASFAFLNANEALPSFAGFAAGTQEYPDRSTTLIVEVPALTGGAELHATGPGIKGEVILSPQGLPEDFTKRWAANRALFPRGIDLILTSGSQLVGLPRSTILKSIGA